MAKLCSRIKPLHVRRGTRGGLTRPFFQYLAHVSSNALNLYAYNHNHCLAGLCKFLGDFWAYGEKDIFSQRIG